MESIEEDYETLHGVLPKKEYRELDNEILGQLLRALNPEELKKVTGDVFGRIYEYFLTPVCRPKSPTAVNFLHRFPWFPLLPMCRAEKRHNA